MHVADARLTVSSMICTRPGGAARRARVELAVSPPEPMNLGAGVRHARGIPTPGNITLSARGPSLYVKI